MRRRRSLVGIAACALVLAVSLAQVVRAEEIKGRWRFDFQLGGSVPGGEIRSAAGNAQTLNRVDATPVTVFDPRPRDLQGSFADSRGRGRIEFHASYGFASRKNSEVILDLGVGYYQQVIHGLELSYSFDSADPDYRRATGCETRIARAGGVIDVAELNGCTWFSTTNELYPGGGTSASETHIEQPDTVELTGLQLFRSEQMEAGTIRAIPISADVLWRYRPTKKLNPYIGGGIGYLLVRLEESERFRQMADQLAGSLVAQVVGPFDTQTLTSRALDPAEYDLVRTVTADGRDVVAVNKLGHRMLRPTIDAPNTAFVQARAGVELQISPKVAIFADGRYMWSQKHITITADGKEKFGTPTPVFTGDLQIGGSVNPSAFPQGGKPVYIIDGGLRQPSYDPDTGQVITDGASGQPGEYYLNGGKLEYGGFVFTAGLRFTL